MANFKHDNSTMEGFLANWLEYKESCWMEFYANPPMVVNDFVNFAASSYEEYNAMWEILLEIEDLSDSM